MKPSPIKNDAEMIRGVNYIKCGILDCGWWYPEGHGCPDHNPWIKCRKKPIEVHYREANAGIETIHTLEGDMVAGYGHDYVMLGIDGEVYPIKKDIYERTYDTLE